MRGSTKFCVPVFASTSRGSSLPKQLPIFPLIVLPVTVASPLVAMNDRLCQPKSRSRVTVPKFVSVLTCLAICCAPSNTHSSFTCASARVARVVVVISHPSVRNVTALLCLMSVSSLLSLLHPATANNAIPMASA